MQLALYRKYRPQNLADLVGQGHIASSLENALKAGRFSHAYLFSGPRGVGKTSTARILAQRINGIKPQEALNHLDIIEIDAASNRRIDEIRDLREKIHIAPSVGDYKVYIIDEVHMLTTEAFNALLKTLEEPPAHAVFVLATTEPHKLPATIISRTQRYNFRPIGSADLSAHLLKVAKAEKITLEPEAAQLIADSADGSVRDALSMLDQAANLSGDVVKLANVTEMLGLVDSRLVEQMLAAVLNSDTAELLKLVGEYSSHGGSSSQLLRQLLRLLHQMLRQQLSGSAASGQFMQQFSNTGALRLITIIKQLAALAPSSPFLEIALEATLVQLASVRATPTEAPDHSVKAAKPVAKAKATATANPPVKTSAKSSDNPDNSWAKVLTKVKQQNNSLYALLRSATPDVKDGVVNVQFRFQFHLRRLEEARNRQLLEQALQQIYGDDTTLRTVLISSSSKTTAAEQETAENKQAVDSVLQILGGEVIGG